MAKKKSTGMSTGDKVGIGVGLTAAAVAAAGYYFLYGSKNAAQNRKAVKSWMLKAKAEVLEALEAAEEMTQDEYEALIDHIAGTYASLKNASKVDISSFKKEMKEHWLGIEKSGKKPKTAKKSAASKAKKPAAKKTAAKPKAKKTAKKA